MSGERVGDGGREESEAGRGLAVFRNALIYSHGKV